MNEVGEVFIAVGTALSVYGALKDKPLARQIGFSMIIGGAGTKFCAGLLPEPQVTNIAEATEAPTPTYDFYIVPTLRVAPSLMATSTLAPTVETPTPSPVPLTPTPSATLSPPVVPLENAISACKTTPDQINLTRVFVRFEVGDGFNNVNEMCLDTSVVRDETGVYNVTLTIPQTPEQYTETAYLTAYIPMTIFPGSIEDYLLKITQCDEECEVFFVDAGGNPIRYSLVTASLDDPEHKKLISAEGYTEGYIVVNLKNTFGGSVVEFTVEPVEK